MTAEEHIRNLLVSQENGVDVADSIIAYTMLNMGDEANDVFMMHFDGNKLTVPADVLFGKMLGVSNESSNRIHG